jgi:hypothetical protein
VQFGNPTILKKKKKQSIINKIGVLYSKINVGTFLNIYIYIYIYIFTIYKTKMFWNIYIYIYIYILEALYILI